MFSIGDHPTTVVFDTDELHPHLLRIFETKMISGFPVKKRRTPQSGISKELICEIFVIVGCQREVEWYVVTNVKIGFTLLALSLLSRLTMTAWFLVVVKVVDKF